MSNRKKIKNYKRPKPRTQRADAPHLPKNQKRNMKDQRKKNISGGYNW